MSRKDYIRFAEMLVSHRGVGASTSGSMGVEWRNGYEAARQDIGRSLAAQLRLDNPNFDAARFYAAAGLDEA